MGAGWGGGGERRQVGEGSMGQSHSDLTDSREACLVQ